MSYDLHFHSIMSDGEFTPEQLIDKAIARGIQAISLTDHDTVAGVERGVLYAKDKITFIPGIELSAFDDCEVHILGYNIDYKGDFLTQKLNELQELRRARNLEIIRKLRAHGVKIKLTNELDGNSKGRSHIAAMLVDQGFVRTRAEAFDKYIGKGAPCYLSTMRITPIEGVKLIVEAGGTAVLAHPYRFMQQHDCDTFLKKMVDVGLKGIEVYYPNYGAEMRGELISLANRYNLICTGGSDHHSESYGAQLGSVNVKLDEYALKTLRIGK